MTKMAWHYVTLTAGFSCGILPIDDVSPSELLSLSVSDLDLKETSAFFVLLRLFDYFCIFGKKDIKG